MTKIIEARCANCMAWVEAAPPPGTAIEIGAPKRGVCHMFPPVPVPQFNERGQIVGQGHLRPAPMAHESCLHFAAREAVNDAQH